MKSHLFPFLMGVCLLPAAHGAPASLDVDPVFPAYGQEIVVQLNNVGPAPYVPATRYQVKGNVITVEIEHVAGGYFGWPQNVAYTPVGLGEIVPGSYTVQARLFDIGDPQSPPSCSRARSTSLRPTRPAFTPCRAIPAPTRGRSSS